MNPKCFTVATIALVSPSEQNTALQSYAAWNDEWLLLYTACSDYPPRWLQPCSVVTWLVPCETAAVLPLVLCIQHNHALVYSVTIFNTKIKSAQKGGPGEENYPVRTWTQDLSIVSPSLYHWAIPHFISVSTSELLNLAISAHLVCHFTFICTYLIWAVAASDCAPTRGLLWSRACDRDGGDARQWGSAGPWWESSSQSARHFAVGVTRAFKVLLVSSCSQDELC